MSTPNGQEGGRGAEVIAVFDLDGTLTYCDTLFPFLRHALGRRGFWLRAPVLLPVLLAYRLRVLERTRAKEAVLRLCIGGWSEERVWTAAAAFAAERLPRLMDPDALERLRWHQEQGHHVVVASATLERYAAPWAASAGIADVLATRLEVVDGRVTGRLDGPNCYGPEKETRLRECIPGVDGRELYVYGDSGGDREVLALARHAHYRPFRAKGHGRKVVVTLARALV